MVNVMILILIRGFASVTKCTGINGDKMGKYTTKAENSWTWMLIQCTMQRTVCIKWINEHKKLMIYTNRTSNNLLNYRLHSEDRVENMFGVRYSLCQFKEGINLTCHCKNANSSWASEKEMSLLFCHSCKQ